jgi:hypothetical protein
MAIPRPHAAFVERALPHFEADIRVVGVAAGGSWTTDSMDEQSDVDLVIALRADSFAAVMAERKAIASRLGPLLTAFTGEHVGEPRLLICLYGPPLLHVDLKFTSVDDLARRVEDPVVLWERDGAITRVLATTRPEWPRPDLQWMEDRFWVWVHYIAAKIIRGEWFEAMDGLAFIRAKILAPLIALAEGKDARGVRHVERDFGSHVDALRRTIATHDAASCTVALRAVAEQYQALRARLATSSLIRRDEAEREALSFLAGVHP